jgi:hypothetical protein
VADSEKELGEIPIHNRAFTAGNKKAGRGQVLPQVWTDVKVGFQLDSGASKGNRG